MVLLVEVEAHTYANGESKALLKEMNEIVRFTLRKHEIRADFRIILATKRRWGKIAQEQSDWSQYAERVQSQLAEYLATERGQRELRADSVSRDKIRQSQQLRQERLKEYERVPTPEEYLTAASMLLHQRHQDPFTKAERRIMASTIRLVNQNRDVDFLILVNISETYWYSLKEKLKTVVHEAIHYVEVVRKHRSSVESIEDESETIVNQFLEKKSAS